MVQGKWMHLISDTQYGIQHKVIESYEETFHSPKDGTDLIPHRLLRSQKGGKDAPSHKLTIGQQVSSYYVLPLVSASDHILKQVWLTEERRYSAQGIWRTIPKGAGVEIYGGPKSTKVHVHQ